MEFVTSKVDGRIAQITFSRGDGRNALSIQAMEELRDTAHRLSELPDLAVVILHGDGAFSCGADLKDPRSDALQQAPLAERRHGLKLGPDLCQAWQDLESYTIAAIEKYCIGGAAALAAAMDCRIMGRGAHLRLPEIPLGMNMSWHALPRLVAQIGPARTKQYAILGEKVIAGQALDWGLCEHVVDDGSALAAARALAGRIAALPPVAVRMTKQAVNATTYALAYATTFMDRDQFMLAATSEECRAAVEAFRRGEG